MPPYEVGIMLFEVNLPTHPWLVLVLLKIVDQSTISFHIRDKG